MVGTKKHKNIAWYNRFLFAPESALIAFAMFMFFTFLMGGGARDDIQSLVVIRPLAILFIGFTLIYKFEMKVVWSKFPIIMLALLALWIAIQLIPLPSEAWMQLPQRQIYADIANMAGIEQPWRPISLSPSKTWNSLFSLAIPLAAMMLFMNIEAKDRKQAILCMMILIALSALWGILQTLGSNRGPLYLYRITNHGVAVGLFANRNHQSAMLVSLILFLGWYGYFLQNIKNINPLKISAAIGGIFILVPLIFITGSRAGLILMVPALLTAIYFFYLAGQSQSGQPHKKPIKISSKKSKKLLASFKANSNNIILVSMVVVILALASGSVIFSRSLAFDRLFADGGLVGLRTKVAPILWAMVNDYMPFGSGFGSFEHVYKAYEPIALLSPTYLNQAHNDWLQFLIEGGLPSALILLTLFIWVGRQSIMILMQWKKLGHDKATVIMCLIFFIIMGAASVGDYPLRVPIVMAIFAVILSYFSQKMDEIRADRKLLSAQI